MTVSQNEYNAVITRCISTGDQIYQTVFGKSLVLHLIVPPPPPPQPTKKKNISSPWLTGDVHRWWPLELTEPSRCQKMHSLSDMRFIFSPNHQPNERSYASFFLVYPPPPPPPPTHTHTLAFAAITLPRFLFSFASSTII